MDFSTNVKQIFKFQANFQWQTLNNNNELNMARSTMHLNSQVMDLDEPNLAICLVY
jgi:hypothetical protein